MAPDQVGFNDLAVDPDGVLRRSLLFVGPSDRPHYSFPLRVVLAARPDLNLTVDEARNQLRLGSVALPALMEGDGGYANIDNRGYQILTRHRTPFDVASKITISQVLSGAIPPAWVEGKVVLIGSTASSLKDEFFTPTVC